MPNENSLWNYHNDGLSQSFMKKFRECKLQTKLEYVDGYTPIVDSVWFRYGHLIHHLLQKGYEEAPITSENIAYKLAHQYAVSHGWFDTSLEEYTVDTNHLLCSVATQIIPKYFFFNIIDVNTTDTLDCEAEYRLPVEDTFIRGILDRVYKDADGNIVIRDYKTTSRRLQAEEFRNEYKLDTQTYLYLTLAAAKWGIVPSKMEYTFIKTPANSYSRRKKDFSTVEWLEKIDKELSSSPSNWLLTIDLKIDSDSLLKWKNSQLLPMVHEIKAWWENGCPGKPYNEQSLRTKFNSKCTMYDLIVYGQRESYYRREKAFTEYK